LKDSGIRLIFYDIINDSFRKASGGLINKPSINLENAIPGFWEMINADDNKDLKAIYSIFILWEHDLIEDGYINPKYTKLLEEALPILKMGDKVESDQILKYSNTPAFVSCLTFPILLIGEMKNIIVNTFRNLIK
jgi:hypothetical protein